MDRRQPMNFSVFESNCHLPTSPVYCTRWKLSYSLVWPDQESNPSLPFKKQTLYSLDRWSVHQINYSPADDQSKYKNFIKKQILFDGWNNCLWRRSRTTLMLNCLYKCTGAEKQCRWNVIKLLPLTQHNTILSTSTQLLIKLLYKHVYNSIRLCNQKC